MKKHYKGEQQHDELFSDFSDTSIERNVPDYRRLDKIIDEDESGMSKRKQKIDLESEDDPHHLEDKNIKDDQDYDPSKLMEGKSLPEKVIVFIIRALIE